MRSFVYLSMHMGMSLAVPTPRPSLIHLFRGSTLTNCCQFHSFFIAMFASIISMCTMSGILRSMALYVHAIVPWLPMPAFNAFPV